MEHPMPSPFSTRDHSLIWQFQGETVRIQPWGPNAVRVRATLNPQFADVPGALLDEPAGARPELALEDKKAVLINGKIRVEVNTVGRIRFFNHHTGAVLLEEPHKEFYNPPMRSYRSANSDLYRLDVRFQAIPGERIYGLGQHQHGRLNQKGCVIELEQRNTEVCIPFMVSSNGYGFLWHNPGIGRVELAENLTRWIAESSRQIDYVVFAGDTPTEIVERYSAAVGRAPLLPEWALGFWQCKLRYRYQNELLAIAREYKKRGLPLAVIVVDYFHWPMMGEWKFDPEFWPEPAAMVQELKEMGVEVMVSVWPTVNTISSSYQEMLDRGLMIRSERNNPALMSIWDRYPIGPSMVNYYDPTNPEARQYIWNKVKKNYHDMGIRVLWLDADEPEIYPMHHDNLRYYAGNGMEVSCIYPLMHQQSFYDGMTAAGEKEFVFLSRSAWAGSQRYGAAVWSGDVPSTFEALREQFPAGLNIGLSGIPWWTTDIGGFHDGDIHDPYFQELIVRWFQYGVFCPLFRLHGVRNPGNGEAGALFSGADNEVWSYGEKPYAIIKDLLFLREKLKPYLMQQNQAAHEKGTPVMRPLFFDFPADASAEPVTDQFMLGPDLLIAPVMFHEQRSRSVYLPAGATWVDAWTLQEYAGGAAIQAAAPIERIPVFWRKGSSFTFQF
jgi:alpha-D-xyloside xylohydrolase